MVANPDVIPGSLDLEDWVIEICMLGPVLGHAHHTLFVVAGEAPAPRHLSH